MGDITFEAAWFDFIHSHQCHDVAATSVWRERARCLANTLAIHVQDLLDWAWVRLILTIVWSVQDKTSYRDFLAKAHCVHPLISTA